MNFFVIFRAAFYVHFFSSIFFSLHSNELSVAETLENKRTHSRKATTWWCDSYM